MLKTSERIISSLKWLLPLFTVTETQFPDLLVLPVHVVENMLKALKMNSEEARLKFPRLLQIIELYPSETLDLMTKEVSFIIKTMSLVCRNVILLIIKEK